MDISGILSQVKSGVGFNNPLSSRVNSALNSVAIPSLVDLTAMANAQAILQSVPAPTQNQLELAHNSVVAAINKTNDLLGHTDKLSGVNLSGSGTLATIAKTMQSARNISGESSCSTVLGAFGSLQNAANLISDSVTTIDSIKSFLEDIPNQIAAIPAIAEAYANRITQQIASDVGVLAQAQIEVIEHAVAQNLVSLFQDECASQVLAAVMTQDMKTEVTKVVTDIKSKKLISLTGK